MVDYSKLNKIVVNPDSPNELASVLTITLGRRFEAEGDDFYGRAELRAGDTRVQDVPVKAIVVRKDEKTAYVLLGDEVYTLNMNQNPFSDDRNEIFSDLFWSGAREVKKRATKAEVQATREYAIKSLSFDRVDDVPEFYARADAATREFVMDRIGDLQDSIDESSGRRAFPKGIDETWLHNRFIQTSSFLSEVFAFPDDVTREIFVTSYLVRNGSCLLSGVPGTGKTAVTSLGSLLFLNGYGYSDYAYQPPVKDPATGKITPFVYRDLNHRGDEDNTANVLTAPPTTAQLDDPDRDWVIVRNVPTTNETEVEPTDRDVARFIKNYDKQLTANDRSALGSGKVRIGRYIGPTKTQNYSRNRTGEQLIDWNAKRFDQHLLNQDYGILMNDYYSRSILTKADLRSPTGNIESLYVSDILYDMAKYPDTGGRVLWVDEVLDERTFLAVEPELDELLTKRRSMTKPDDITAADERISELESLRSNIRKKRDLPRDKWGSVYGQGRKGKMSEAELEQINQGYINLYESLYELVHRTDNTQVRNARSDTEILSEMEMDMGVTTCSENKTPEDILYSMDISLAKDVDSIGRPVQQYVFKPTPLGFVTKPGKFLNEFSRADKDFQDQLLSVLDRGAVEYRGEIFKSPQFSLYCDNNPHKLLTSQIDWALWDRVDIELFLRGASLGTKDMVLSRKFGREDVLMGKTEMKSNMQKEMLTRIRHAVDSLNEFKRSQVFRDTGKIDKLPGEPQGIIPMRVREIQEIWDHIDNVSIPRDVLHYVFLLTTTMNQAWYLRKLTVNDGNGDSVEIPDTEVVGSNFEPYGPAGKISPREAMLDYSMLSFATDFIEVSTVISNIGIDKAKDQFPLGITRQVGMRFVESLLKYAKALAWFRRGHTQVTTKEIDDLFPVVGSHRLNVIPFGEDYVAGIDDTIKELYPNIQDYLKYGLLDKYWLPRKDQYIQYYADLESVVNAGFLNVDDCPPSQLDAKAGGLCKIRGNYSHSSLQSQEKTDVMILDIQNGVEFAKRNSPDYRRHYSHRLEQIINIGTKNYYEDFINDAEKFINNNDCNEGRIPMQLFRKDADELISRLSSMKQVFEPDAHVQTLTDMSVVSKVALGVIDGLHDYVEPASLQKLDKARSDFEGLIFVYRTLLNIQSTDDITTMYDVIGKILKKSGAELGKMSQADITKALNDKLDSASISATSIKLKPYKFVSSKRKKPLTLQGEVNIVYNPTAAEQYISLVAKTFNDHLLWEHVRFSERLVMNEPVEDNDRLV